jgi:phage shock protein PspC (stress-responsive transcriptional regulator)
VTSGTRVLRRSREDFLLLGGCGGLGRFFGIDPGWFRIGFLFLPIAYLVAGVAIPLERPRAELGPPTSRMRARAARQARHGGGFGAVLGAAVRSHVLRRSS